MSLTDIQLDIEQIFIAYHNTQVSAKQCASGLKEYLLRVLALDQVMGEERRIIRDTYNKIDEALDDYLIANKVNDGSESSRLESADERIKNVLVFAQDKIQDFFRRQDKVASAVKETTPIQTKQDDVPDKELNEIQLQIEKDPSDIAYNRLGNYHFRVTMDYEEAIRQYQKAISINPIPYVYYLNIADSFQELKKYDDSIIYYKKALEKRPRDDSIMNSLGNAYFRSERYEEAILWYLDAQRINREPVYLLNIGDSYSKLNDWSKAIKYYNSAIFLKGDYMAAYGSLALALMEKYISEGNADKNLLVEAIKSCKQCIELEPDTSYPYTYLCQLYVHLGNWDDAIQTCQKAVQLDNLDVGSHLNIGISHLRKAEYPEAEKAFNRVLDIDPKNTLVLRYIAEFNEAFKKEEDSIKNYKEYLKSQPDDFSVLSCPRIYRIDV